MTFKNNISRWTVGSSLGMLRWLLIIRDAFCSDRGTAKAIVLLVYLIWYWIYLEELAIFAATLKWLISLVVLHWGGGILCWETVVNTNAINVYCGTCAMSKQNGKSRVVFVLCHHFFFSSVFSIMDNGVCSPQTYLSLMKIVQLPLEGIFERINPEILFWRLESLKRCWRCFRWKEWFVEKYRGFRNR